MLRYWIFILLFLWIGAHLWHFAAIHIPHEIEGKSLQVVGEIVDTPVVRKNSTRFLFKTESYGVVQLDWYQSAPKLAKGEQWALSVRLKNPRNYNNPGGFNYERYLFFKKISVTGYVENKSKSRLIFSPPSKISIREDIANTIDTVLEFRPSAALIKGLTVGVRDTMQDDQWELLQQTGTSHLLAISGLHIGLVSGILFFLIRRLWVWLPYVSHYIAPPMAGAVAAIVGALIYAALAGFAIPTQRALVMITVAMLCYMTSYQFSNTCILLIAAVMVILIDPFALLSPSFWLSFGAVGVLLFVMRQQDPKWYHYLNIQWYISLGLAPFVIAYFQHISWISPIANLIAIPFASFIVVPCALLGVMAYFIHQDLATFFWLLTESALQYLWWFLNLMANIPYAAQDYQITFARAWVALLGGIILLLLPRGMPGKYLGYILIGTLFFTQTPKPLKGELWMSVLDVGQGLAIVLQTTHHTLLYDVGMRYDTFDLGETVVVPFLKYQGVKAIDLMILSHNNLDHTGGAPYIMQSMPVKKIIAGEDISNIDADAYCRAGQSFVFDDVAFEFLYPNQIDKKNSNNNSCVLQIKTGSYSALITGDIEKEAEGWLIENRPDTLQNAILIAPHHGSKTSSTLPFVQKIKAQYVVFATGYLNRFQFPREEVVQRYASRGATIYDTAKTGAVMFRMSSAGIVVD